MSDVPLQVLGRSWVSTVRLMRILATWELSQREIGNLLPNNQRQRRTCYALCHILYPMSAALASFFRMDSISTSFTSSFDLRNRAHFLPPRPVDSTAYLTPPSWASMARANPLYRSVHRPPVNFRRLKSSGSRGRHAAPSVDKARGDELKAGPQSGI